MAINMLDYNESMPELTPEEIYPRIHVYRGVFNDPYGFIEQVKLLPSWEAWWTFGEMVSLPGLERVRFETKPTLEEWENFLENTATQQAGKPGVDLSLYVDRLFYRITEDYMKKYPLEIPNWSHQKPSIAKYVALGGVDDDRYSMHYHTDFQREKADAPGLKYALTCTMYLNDDYEGGELTFKIANDSGGYDAIDYKPRSGDVVVFPSTEPYFHGVKQITSGDRYFIRTFWTHEFEGTPEWLAGQAKYGEEVWAEMEKKRESAFRHSQSTDIYND